MRIRFCGAVGEVTGSGYLVETRAARVLVDFGMFQGRGATEARNRSLGPIDPAALDAIVVTHAHLDHLGRLPLLPGRGFKGRIHATPATVDFGGIVLADSARLQVADAERLSRRLLRAGKPPAAPLYGTEEVEAVRPHFFPLRYGDRREIADGICIRLVDAGHILGSSSVEMTVKEAGQERVVAFSGDIGLKGSAIVRDPTPLEHADLVFLESTYGDRDHRSMGKTVEEFHQIVTQAIETHSKILIPAFAIGRAQQILYHIAELVRGGTLPRFPIYLDSPMAIEATRLYDRYKSLFDEEAAALSASGQLRKDLAQLHFVETPAESRALNDSWDMSVIIAGSGMCDGGRIVHHLRHNLWRLNVAVVIVGYQAEGSLGRRLVRGAKEVRIFGEKIAVRAAIHTLGGFSAHAGQTELIEWVRPLVRKKPRIVLTHGETAARNALRETIKARFGVDAECPGPDSVVEL
jgi:metallo-beta-lactamase family protein